MSLRRARILDSARGAHIDVANFGWRPGQPPTYTAKVISHGQLESGGAATRPGQRIVLMFHGWSVRREALVRNYDSLLRQIWDLEPRAFDEILTVSWPARGQYWEVLPTTPLVGAALADRLCADAPFRDAREVVFVAHSMGCRVALELVRALQTRGFTPGIRLFLVAAAVPVAALEGHRRLSLAARSVDHASVYYSHIDEALGPLFQIGQTLAHEGDWALEAVGLRGGPTDGVWTRRVGSLRLHVPHFRSSKLARDIVDDYLQSRMWREKAWRPAQH